MRGKISLAALLGATLVLPAAAAYATAASEVATAAQHAGFAAAAPDIAQTHMHLHHAVNCLVGPKGAGFDATNANPCAKDGAGAIPDESDATVKARLQSVVATAEAGIASSDLATAHKDATTVAGDLKAIK